MSESIVVVDQSNYEIEVEGSALPVVIDFWAPWCGPCLALLPTIEAVAALYQGKIKVVKINVDENKEISQKYGVRGIPYLVVRGRLGGSAMTAAAINALARPGT